MVRNKRIPLRKCIGCMEQKPKKELLRVVRTPEGTLCMDATGKMNGRGAYLCHEPECFDKMVKSRRLGKEFDMQIEPSVYEELRRSFDEIVNVSGGDTIGK